MSKSPGYQKRPGHRIESVPARKSLAATAHGELVGQSAAALQVTETGSPVRFYFPRTDVRMQMLQPSATTSYCPFKGTASYFNIMLPDRVLRDAVWSYEDPYEEHPELRGLLAFYEEKHPELKVSPTASVGAGPNHN